MSEEHNYDMFLESLTRRERDVYRLRLQGLCFKFVAEELGITMNCAKVHSHNLTRKAKDHGLVWKRVLVPVSAGKEARQ